MPRNLLGPLRRETVAERNGAEVTTVANNADDSSGSSGSVGGGGSSGFRRENSAYGGRCPRGIRPRRAQ